MESVKSNIIKCHNDNYPILYMELELNYKMREIYFKRLQTEKN